MGNKASARTGVHRPLILAIQDAEAGKLYIQGHHGLQSEIKANLSYRKSNIIKV